MNKQQRIIRDWDIFTDHDRGQSEKALAVTFNLTPQTIRRIIKKVYCNIGYYINHQPSSELDIFPKRPDLYPEPNNRGCK